jgi:hypothetical protein
MGVRGASMTIQRGLVWARMQIRGFRHHDTSPQRILVVLLEVQGNEHPKRTPVACDTINYKSLSSGEC